MSNKISVKEFDEWLDEHGDILEAIDNRIYNYDDDDLNAEDKKILEDFLSKELDIKYGKVNDGMTLYNVFYIYDGVHEYEGTTNNIKTWLANHNMNRLYEGNNFEWEDQFSFEEINSAIYKESKHE
jgi:hypothetical protein